MYGLVVTIWHIQVKINFPNVSYIMKDKIIFSGSCFSKRQRMEMLSIPAQIILILVQRRSRDPSFLLRTVRINYTHHMLTTLVRTERKHPSVVFWPGDTDTIVVWHFTNFTTTFVKSLNFWYWTICSGWWSHQHSYWNKLWVINTIPRSTTLSSLKTL